MCCETHDDSPNYGCAARSGTWRSKQDSVVQVDLVAVLIELVAFLSGSRGSEFWPVAMLLLVYEIIKVCLQ